MSDINDLKPNTMIEFILPLEWSQKKMWLSRSNSITKNDIKYGTVIGFHNSIDDAIKVAYRLKGFRHTLFLHWKDLKIIDEIPNTKPDAALFDVNNLNI